MSYLCTFLRALRAFLLRLLRLRVWACPSITHQADNTANILVHFIITTARWIKYQLGFESLLECQLDIETNASGRGHTVMFNALRISITQRNVRIECHLPSSNSWNIKDR